eukprot:403377178
MEKAAIKIGWIGTGVMGKSMCGHLMKSGYNLSIYTRTASKADDLIQNGAQFKEPKELAQTSDVLFLMLGYPHDVEQVVLDEKNGILQHMKEGAVLIDHTTSSPGLALRIYEAAKQRGVKSIDAPVSGGDIGARNGTLVTMVGGDKEVVDQSYDILKTYSAEVQHMGDGGAGQHTKMANQIMIANTMVGTCEALIYGHKAGLDLHQMILLLNKGAAGSFSLDKLAPRMLRRDFEPGFYVEHFIKDLGIALEEARRMKLGLPGLALASQLYQALGAQGFERKGTQALLLALEQLNGTQIRKYDI